MTLAQFPELKKLSKKHRQKLADELWQSTIDDRTPVSREQQRALDQRWSYYQSGKIKRITLAELERRLSRP